MIFGVKALRVSADGAWRVAVDGAGTTRVTSFPDGSPVASFAKADYDDAWFWPPAARVAIAAPTYVDVATLPSAQRLMLPAGQVDGQLLAISPSGDLLAYLSTTSVVVRDRDGNVKRTIARGALGATVGFSPTGDRLALGLSDGTLQVLALDGGADVGPVSAHANGVHAVAFAPDGAHIVSGGPDGLGILWRASDLANVRTFTVSTASYYANTALAVSPDGSLVAFGTGATTAYQARLFRVADASLVTTMSGFPSGFLVNAIAFSPDSKRVILAGGDSTIRTWCLP
jgi:WD40 repeat protein